MSVVNVFENRDGLGTRWWATGEEGFLGGSDELVDLERMIGE